MVVTVDTNDMRRTMHNRRQTTPGVWHKLTTCELKMYGKAKFLLSMIIACTDVGIYAGCYKRLQAYNAH